LLQLLAPIEPPWTLTGGAALASVHTQHRETRDLDLFWREREGLGDLAVQAVERLRAAGYEVQTSRSGPAFVQLRVRDKAEEVLIDLVAEPAPPLTTPGGTDIAGVPIRVDTREEILAEKLCAVLERTEVRDLFDIKVLLEHGASLADGLAAAPRKDGGFSPLAVAWTLKDFPVERLAKASGLPDDLAGELDVFRHDLVRDLLARSRPS
jgi:hypothetical protein